MKRRKARELALSILFQIDVSKTDINGVINTTFEQKEYDEEVKKFATEIVRGTIENIAKIDNIIKKYSIDWEIQRMPNVDRNILRLAIFEILYRDDIPPSVSINEAVELAKKYSTEDSGKFVNGILGNFIRHIND